MRKFLVSCVAALAFAAPVAACSSGGNISRSDALKQLQKDASTSQEKALASCIVGKLYDSGKFSDDEIQKVVKADTESDVGSDLYERFSSDALKPCITDASGAGDTNS